MKRRCIRKNIQADRTVSLALRSKESAEEAAGKLKRRLSVLSFFFVYFSGSGYMPGFARKELLMEGEGADSFALHVYLSGEILRKTNQPFMYR